jgi:hypothetical protein
MRLKHWGPLLLAILSSTPHTAASQSSEYVVTATLNPYFIHPDTGEDITRGKRLQPYDGLVRGADGWLYGIRANADVKERDDIFAIIRVNPATGAATVLSVSTAQYQYLWSYFRLGREGRLYFTARDRTRPQYGSAPPACVSGCVMYIDTANAGKGEVLWDFAAEDPRFGVYINAWGILEEDTDGAVYVETEYGNFCEDGRESSQGALMKIDDTWGEPTVLESYGCDDPPFDWSTVTLSSYYRPWSDGRSYFAQDSPSGSRIYQYDHASDTTTLLATIAPSDGPALGLAEGAGYVYGVTRSGGALNGGVVFRIRVPSLVTPDLVVTGMSSAPAFAAPGSTFAVTDTTTNDGPEPAAPSGTAFYLSRDGNSQDVKLINRRLIPELWPTVYSSGGLTVKIPATTPAATYWLLACADAALVVEENDDVNNCRRSDTQITVAHPDLRQMSVSTSVAYASPGSKVIVHDTVENIGLVKAPLSTTRFYLSLDPAKGAGDYLLTGKRAIPELLPGTTSSGNATLTLPLSVPGGLYYVIGCADDLAKLKEVGEANNCAAYSSTILVGWPDLVVADMRHSPDTAIRGGKFTAFDTVVNQGTIPAATSYTRYYLSLDGTKDASDVLLSGIRAVTTLNAGASSAGSRAVTVPLATPLGTYRVLACADDTSKVGENDNANNCRASTTTVTIH